MDRKKNPGFKGPRNNQKSGFPRTGGNYRSDRTDGEYIADRGFGGRTRYNNTDKPRSGGKSAQGGRFTTAPARAAEHEAPDNSGLVAGRNAVLELLKGGRSVDKLFVQSGRREGSITKIVAMAVAKSIPVIEADKSKLDSLAVETSHQGVVAFAAEKDYCTADDILAIAKERGEAPFVVVADGVMDPHNLGAVIRTAECAGAHGVIIPKRRATGLSGAVGKASAGALEHMAVAKVANISETIKRLKKQGLWIFAAAGEDETAASGVNPTAFDAADYNVPCAVVLGGEGEGLSRIVAENADYIVNIPVYGKINSLNVSCAAAVILYAAASMRRNGQTL